MKKIHWIIHTPYGNKYELSEEGYVLRYSNGLDKRNASVEELKTWQVTGGTSTHPFAAIRSYTLDELSKMPLLHKNGNPKYTILDIDHGTRRVVGNTTVHGIKSIEKVS